MRQVRYVLLGGFVAASLVATALVQQQAGGAVGEQVLSCATSGCHLQVSQHQRLHEPVAANRCDTCRQPKERATPCQPGVRHEFKRAADNLELCYACHDVEMVEEERDEEATDFRNGDLNLHCVHVNREDKRITCGAGHDVHAGKNPKHIADPMPFGERAILIGYKPTTTGGSCQTRCHKTWAYDRVNPVQNERN